MGARLKGRNAVVTGAGRGIGREIALALAAEGARVLVNDPGVSRDGSGRDVSPADEVVAEIKKGGGAAIANYESVTDFAAAERIIKSCIDNFSRIDIVVNPAGVLRDRMIFNMSEDEWDMVISVHLKGTFNMCRHACVPMRAQRYGRIINVASTAWLGSTGQANYAAAKGGIVSFTRTLALDLGRYGITCNSICPTASTRMTMNDEVKAGFKMKMETGAITKERYEELMDMPGPEFVPPAVVYLASDEAANINGQVIRATGGQVGIYSEPVMAKSIHKDYKKLGPWTVDELIDIVPKTLLVGYVNPMPPAEKK